MQIGVSMYAYNIIFIISIFVLMFLVATTYILYHKKQYLWFIPYGILSSVLSFFLAWALAFIIIVITKNTDSELIFIMSFYTFFCIIFAKYFLKKKYKEVNKTRFIMLTMLNISLFIIAFGGVTLLLFSWILGFDFVFNNISFIILEIITNQS